MIEENFDRELSDAARKLGLGATGQHPHGSLGPTDEGELKVGLTIVGEKLVLNFGKSVSWVAMTREEAIELACALLRKCGYKVSALELP